MSLLSPIETAISPYTVWIKVALYAVAVLALIGGGFYAGLRWDESKVLKLQLADQKASNTAVTLAVASTKRQDAVILTAAVSEAKAQQQIVTRTVTLTKEIDHDVPSTTACIPVGLIRLLNGAAANANVADASVAPGQPDDACSAVSWRSLAADLADDYSTGNQNAEQLNALEAAVVARDKAVSP